MTENNTVKFTTKAGTVIETLPYITGRQGETLTEVTGETVEKKNLALSHKTIELVVVSVNGKTEDILNTILDLPLADYLEIVGHVQEIATGKKNETDSAKI